MEHLVRIGRKPKELLEGPPRPEELTYLWLWYCQLESCVRMGAAGREAIGWTDIQAWASLMGHAPQPHEVMALMAIDRTTRFPGKLGGEEDEDSEG